MNGSKMRYCEKKKQKVKTEARKLMTNWKYGEKEGRYAWAITARQFR
jgi:hypothetical protein